MALACRCGGCQAEFKVRDEMAGKLGKCPRCGDVFRVPAAIETGQTEDSISAADQSAYPAVSGAPRVQVGTSPVAAASRPGSSHASSKSRRAAGRTAAKRGRGKPPIWVWHSAGLIAIVALVGIIMALRGGDDAPVVQDQPGSKKKRGDQPPTPPTHDAFAGAMDGPEKLADPYAPGLVPTGPKKEEKRVEKPQPGAPLDEYARYAEHAIVKLDVYSDDFNQTDSLGSGFIIDIDQRLVVTNYHVLQSAVKAHVKFNNGVRFGVLGYVAVKPESDLAIIQVNGLPPQATALEMKVDGDPQASDAVVSIGHPLGHEFQVTRGQVDFVKRTRELPDDIRAFLHEGIHNSSDDEVWIKHSAEINPGNSGGPVLNAHGEVLGVNTFKRTTEPHGYALHAKHVAELLQHRLNEPEPLTKYFRPRQPQGMQLSIADLKPAFEAAAATNWTPQSPADAEKIAKFALIFTLARQVAASDAQLPDKAEWKKQTEEIHEALRSTTWNSGHAQALNGLAASAELKPGLGLMAIGKVRRTFQHQAEGGAAQIVHVEIEGAKKQIFVPMPPGGAVPADGARLLVVGFVGGALAADDGTGQPLEAPVVVSTSLFVLQ